MSSTDNKYITSDFWSTHLEKFLKTVESNTTDTPLYSMCSNIFKFGISFINILEVIMLFNKRQDMIDTYKYDENALDLNMVMAFDDGLNKLQHKNLALLWIIDNWKHNIFGGQHTSESIAMEMLDTLLNRYDNVGFIQYKSESAEEIRRKILAFVHIRNIVEKEAAQMKECIVWIQNLLLDIFVKEITEYVMNKGALTSEYQKNSDINM